jgi:Na+-transporting NADH:ubiquinone oxidoreductase, subunit NqrF
MDYTVVVASIVVFLVLTFSLVGILLGAKSKLLPSGPVNLKINGDNEMEVSSGGTLLSTLGNNKIFLPSACGGGGTCIQCKCQILDGGGEILPTEKPHFSRKEIAEGWRLGCQVKVNQIWVLKFPRKYLESKNGKQLLSEIGM